ncbi:MAG: hypothetical protein GXX89_08135 [Clostridiales bacterium]|jgi:hypothetical protein|nr:hypothetical protein [Clostridiales bacterium]
MAGLSTASPSALTPKSWAPVKRDYPVTPRENLMMALNHKKPLWMPNIGASSQLFGSKIAHDSPPAHERTMDTTDWFGVRYKYSPAYGSNTPQGNVLNCVTEWREKIVWPDLDSFDWAAEAAEFMEGRDESLALCMRMSNGLFERLHMIEGFEQALVDLILEPETVQDYLFAVADFKIDLFNHMRDHMEFDYVVCADDWGTMRAPFFSTDTFERTILEPTKRFVQGVHARGTKFIAHCCGVIEPFVPYMVEEIGFDALEIQTDLNDVGAILAKYGDRITVQHGVRPGTAQTQEMTVEEARAAARKMVDTYGAHAVPGPGVLAMVSSPVEQIYYAIEEEIYEYSKERYSGPHVRR